MVIDIIAFTDLQFALLSEEQVEKVRLAQLKKNKLTENLKKNKEAEKYKLVKRGIFRSGIYEKICEKLEETYETEVADVRDGLLFYLRFTSKSDGAASAPYPVNYSLTYEQRYTQVKTYYDEAYSDGKARFQAFEKDEVAVDYLGEYYKVLYDYYAVRV